MGQFPPWGCRDRVDILTKVVRPLLVGQVLNDPARLYRSLAQRVRGLANQLGAVGPFQQALSGADIALWDAVARRAGLPLAQHIAQNREITPAVDVYATNLPISAPASIEAMGSKGHVRFKFRIPAEPALVLERLMRLGR